MLAGHRGDVGVDALALDVVRITDNGSFGYLRVGNERGFNLGRAHTVSGNVDDTVDPACNPIVHALSAVWRSIRHADRKITV